MMFKLFKNYANMLYCDSVGVCVNILLNTYHNKFNFFIIIQVNSELRCNYSSHIVFVQLLLVLFLLMHLNKHFFK